MNHPFPNGLRLLGRGGPAQSIGGVVDGRTGLRTESAELLARAGGCASALQPLGVVPGSRVVIMAAESADFLVGLLGIWAAGACAVAVDPTWTKPEIERVIRFSDPQLVLGDAASSFPSDVGPPALDLTRLRAPGHTPAAMETPPDSPALVLFTSGTTGHPKGVVHSYASLGARIRLNHVHMGDPCLKRALCPLSLYFGHGLIGNTLTPLFAGGDVVLLTRPEFADWAAMGTLIDRFAITFVSSVPAMWPLIRELSAPPRNGSLARVHVGSAPLSAANWNAVITWCGTREVVNMWGITEAANWIAGASARSAEAEDGRVGNPWGGEVSVLDGAGEYRACGEGELCLRSPALMSGYLHAASTDGPLDAQGWFRTGDLGGIDDDGGIRLIGRSGSTINRGGTKVQPEEVEALLESHPSVREACVFALDDELVGEQVAAALVLTAAAAPGPVRQWCAQRLRAAAVPQRWYVLDALPRTGRGKLDRARVRTMCGGARAEVG